MISFIIRKYIKNYDKTDDPVVRNAYGKLSGIAGIFFNLLLFAGKLAAGTIASSIAVIADAFNNLSDAGSSVITILGFKLAEQKPDPEHPFGHGRYEYISGLVVSMIIVVMGFELFRSSIDKIKNPEEITFNFLTLSILIASILVKLYIAYYNNRIGNLIHSASIKAISTDSISDCISTFAVGISMAVEKLFGVRIDGWCGLAVALLIMYAGIKSASDTINPLLGQPADPEFVHSIEKIVLSHNEILGIHDLIVHDYGPGRKMVSLHAEVPVSGDMAGLHDTIDNIEHEIFDILSCEAVIHMDPVDVDNELVQMLKQVTINAVKEIDDSITIHDFRIVSGPTHTNLLFDVVVPYKFKLSDKEIKDLIQKKLSAVNPAYFTVVNIDKSYVLQEKE